MSWDQAYLDAVGVPRWVPRDAEVEVAAISGTETNVSASSIEEPISAQPIPENETAQITWGVKALVNNADAKFAILVDAEQPKSELQKAWKQLKFAWKQWHNQEFPASLFQLNYDSEFKLTQLDEQNLLVIDTTEQSAQVQKIVAPKLLQDKKSWWELLQQVAEKSQLL